MDKKPRQKVHLKWTCGNFKQSAQRKNTRTDTRMSLFFDSYIASGYMSTESVMHMLLSEGMT